MKELSLNILDIAENSLKAGATLTEIEIKDTGTELNISIKDNGCGMSEEMLRSVTDPFCTTRTTRKVGLGIPLFKMAAELTGGYLKLASRERSKHPTDHGTEITAHFKKDHLDFTPLGDVTSSIVTLIQGHPDSDFLFTHTGDGLNVKLDTREMREVLDDIPLDSFEILTWISENLKEQYKENK